MQIQKVTEGDDVSMPLIAIDSKGGGVTRIKSLINGILIRMTPGESQCGVIFVSEDALQDVGYFLEAEQRGEDEKG